MIYEGDKIPRLQDKIREKVEISNQKTKEEIVEQIYLLSIVSNHVKKENIPRVVIATNEDMGGDAGQYIYDTKTIRLNERLIDLYEGSVSYWVDYFDYVIAHEYYHHIVEVNDGRHGKIGHVHSTVFGVLFTGISFKTLLSYMSEYYGGIENIKYTGYDDLNR